MPVALVLQALFAGTKSVVVAAFGVPEFAGYEQLSAGLPRLPYTLSYRAFIAIDGRSVYVGITSENRLADRIHANVPVRGLESAESRARDGITVI